jgi:hypothetical protein
MGRHLPHAPAEYLEQMVFADILDLWKEKEISEVPYEMQGLRGKVNNFMLCLLC